MVSIYRALGVRTLPVRADKKPYISRWQQVELNSRWEERFPDASIGAICGEVFTVVDVDDPAFVDRARERFGDTPVEVRTRKGYHLYYKASGERKHIRAFGDHVPIDILGKGQYVIVPNSAGYTFSKGAVEDLAHLPAIPATALPVRSISSLVEAAGESGRNDALFRHGLKLVANAQSLDEVKARLAKENHSFDAPLPKAEVDAVAGSVWKIKQEGRLLTAGRPGVLVYREDLDMLRPFPDALALYVDLKDNWGWRKGSPFTLSNNTRERYDMTVERFNRSWRILEQMGYIQVVHRGGTGAGDTRKVRLIA